MLSEENSCFLSIGKRFRAKFFTRREDLVYILLPLESWSFGVVGQPLTLILPASLNFLSLAASASAGPSSNSGRLLVKFSNFQASAVYTERGSKIGFRQPQQPQPSCPPASINLFKLICFGVGNLARIQGASLLNSRFLSHVRYRLILPYVGHCRDSIFVSYSCFVKNVQSRRTKKMG